MIFRLSRNSFYTGSLLFTFISTNYRLSRNHSATIKKHTLASSVHGGSADMTACIQAQKKSLHEAHAL